MRKTREGIYRYEILLLSENSAEGKGAKRDLSPAHKRKLEVLQRNFIKALGSESERYAYEFGYEAIETAFDLVRSSSFKDRRVPRLMLQIEGIMGHFKGSFMQDASDKKLTDRAVDEMWRACGFDDSHSSRLHSAGSAKLLSAADSILHDVKANVQHLRNKDDLKEIDAAIKILDSEIKKMRGLQHAVSRERKVAQIHLALQISTAVCCIAIISTASVASFGIVPMAVAGALAGAMFCAFLWSRFEKGRVAKKLSKEYASASNVEEAIGNFSTVMNQQVERILGYTSAMKPNGESSRRY